MREIKFRAWDKNSKQIGRVIGVGFNDRFVWVKLNSGLTETWFFRNIEIMQYTGLKDKNGVEIYEGDIVKCKNYHGNVKGVIDYSDSVYYLSCLSGYSDEYLFNCSDFEIIGNIHENKELIDSDR